MKELIKRIKAHDGEVKEDWESDNKVVVEFVPKQWVVKCGNKEQYDFIAERIDCITKWMDDSAGTREADCINIKSGLGSNTEFYKECGFNIIPFTKYISDNDLKDEWDAYRICEAEKRYPKGVEFKSAYSESYTGTSKGEFSSVFSTSIDEIHVSTYGGAMIVYHKGKWAEIIEPKLDLVKGEVYLKEESGLKKVFRVKRQSATRIDYYSFKYVHKPGGDFFADNSYIQYKGIKPATNKQKAKLVKAEIKNGWFWDGEDLLKL